MMNKSSAPLFVTKPITVIIVIVNYFSAELTKKLVEQINAFNVNENIKTSIVCIDNSINKAQERALNEIKTDSACSLDVIINSKNLGFGKAVNTGLNHRHFDFACTINPDVTLLDNTLEILLTQAVTHEAQGLWGGLTVNNKLAPDYRHAWQEPSLTNTLGWAIWLKYLINKPQWQDNYRHKPALTDHPYSVDCISGCCFLISAQVWKATAGFDTDFFLYSEEVDLCRRARKLGYQPTVVPQAKLIHSSHSKSESTKRISIIYTAKLRYASKHHGLIYNIIYRLLVALGATIRAIKALFLGQRSNSAVWAKLSLKVLLGSRDQL